MDYHWIVFLGVWKTEAKALAAMSASELPTCWWKNCGWGV